MGRAFARVTAIELDGDYAEDPIPSVRVECVKCSNAVEIYGDSEDSVTRGMVTLRETCPRGEKNLYVRSKAWGS